MTHMRVKKFNAPEPESPESMNWTPLYAATQETAFHKVCAHTWI